MVHIGGEDPFAELKTSHRDYKVFDGHYERVGKVDELFVDEDDHPIYLGVSTGLLEARSLLIPMDIVRVNDKRMVVEVAASRTKIEDSPSLGAHHEVSPEIEDKVRIHYGLDPLHSSSHQTGDAREPATEDPLAFDERIDLIPGEREATQQHLEGDPPYRERDDQLRRNRERDAEREARERETGEREDAGRDRADPRNSNEERETERPRNETRSRNETTGSKVRRLMR